MTTRDIKLPLHGHIMREIEKSKRGPSVKSGVQSKDFDSAKKESHGSGTGATLGEVAVYNEFGTAIIPERSFIRHTHDSNKEEWNRKFMALIHRIESGQMTVEDALKIGGETMTAAIKNRIATIAEPPNAPLTVALKGSSKPLIDTGQLVNSIHYELEGLPGMGKGEGIE